MEKSGTLYTTFLTGYSSSVDRRIPFSVPLRYKKLHVISLDYGVVGVSAIDTTSGRKVAIHRYTIAKDVRWLKQTWKLMQLRKHLNHPNIARLLYCYTVEESFTQFASFYLICESMDSCLQYISISMHMASSHRMLSQIVHQILTALSFLHANGIVLRTLNSGNVLMDFVQSYDNDVSLKLIANPLIPQVSAYNSPECLLSNYCFDPKTDSWTVGCLFGELLLRTNLFSINTDQTVLFAQMLDICEKPGETFVKKFSRTLKFKEVFDSFDDDEFGVLKDNFPEDCFPSPDINYPDAWNEDSGMDLLSRLLVLDASERYSVEEALNHPYVNMWNCTGTRTPQPSFVFSPKSIDALYLNYREWRAMFYREVIDMEMTHPLKVHSLQDSCVHRISCLLGSSDGADSLCLPSSIKMRLKSHMNFDDSDEKSTI